MSLIAPTWLVALVLGCGLIAYYRRRNNSKLPPGPRTTALFGHGQTYSWKWAEELYRSYGPVVGFRAGGDYYVLLSNPSDAQELLEKQAVLFSGRKAVVYAGKYRSNNKRMLLLPHGDALHKQRAMFKFMVRSSALQSYYPREELHLARLLNNLLRSPLEYHSHLYRFTAGIIMAITYGIDVNENEGVFEEILQSNASFNTDAVPGAHLVDAFPWLDYLPGFLSPWRREARKKHEMEMNLFGRLASNAKKRAEDGIDTECLLAHIWDSKIKYELDDETIAYLGGSAFEAGTSVTAFLIHTFLLACVNNPEVVRKAQAELDRVAGDNLPQYNQMKKMPYIHAVVKETIRWVPVTPLAFPHQSEVDVEFNGYHIPAKSLIIPSIWNMHRDQNNYPEPDTFNPERWFDPDNNGYVKSSSSLLDEHWSFGFGRRECPGKYLAVDLIWGAIASLLWAFDIGKMKDSKTGDVIDVNPADIRWNDGVNIEPTPFPLSITPRSNVHVSRIRSSCL